MRFMIHPPGLPRSTEENLIPEPRGDRGHVPPAATLVPGGSQPGGNLLAEYFEIGQCGSQ
jgi:hypothetical protein